MSNLQRFLARFDLPLLMLLTVGVMLAACDMKAPSQMNTTPIQVRSAKTSNMIPVAAFQTQTAKDIAAHYARYGDGPVTLTITYPAGERETRALDQGNRLAKLLSAQRVPNVQVATLPVNDPDMVGQVMVNYTQVTAHAPADCMPHPAENRADIAGREDGRLTDYRFGCGIDSYIAQQIARPKDLLGSDKMDPATADRFGTTIKDYRDGKDYKDLKGTNASEATSN